MGADAHFVTPGRWILDETCVGLLLAAPTSTTRLLDGTRGSGGRAPANNGKRDDPAYVEALLGAGADVHARAFGKTALHFASKAGFVGATSALLAAGADPNALDGDGLTPLSHLLQTGARADRATIARLLLDAGADPSVTDAKGMTPRDVVVADRKRSSGERATLIELLSATAAAER